MATTPLAENSDLQLTCNILLMTCSAADRSKPELLFEMLLRDIRQREIDVDEPREALWEWFQRECARTGSDLPVTPADRDLALVRRLRLAIDA